MGEKNTSHSRKWVSLVPLKKLLIAVYTHFDNYALHIYTHTELCFQNGQFFSYQNGPF